MARSTSLAAMFAAAAGAALLNAPRYVPRALTRDAHRRQAAAGFTATHVKSHRLVAHDKRDAAKARNQARHKRAMKRRGRK